MAKKDSEKTEAEGGAVETCRQPAARSVGCRRQADDQARQEARLCHLCRTECGAAVRGSQFRADRGHSAMLNEMGINVVETEEAEEAEAEEAPRKRRSRAANSSRCPAEGRRDPHVRARRPHRRSGAHVSARNGLGRAAVARGRNRDRQAHRGRPRGDDRRALRKPSDLSGHHHLARRAERRARFSCATSSISKRPMRAPTARTRRRST